MSGESRSEYLSVKTLGLKSGLLGGKRLKQALPHEMRPYEKHVEPLSPECRDKLLKISLAGIDRLLKPYQAQLQRRRNAGTKPGTQESDSDPNLPCGGSFIGSIPYTDIKRNWTVIRAVWNKGKAAPSKSTTSPQRPLNGSSPAASSARSRKPLWRRNTN